MKTFLNQPENLCIATRHALSGRLLPLVLLCLTALCFTGRLPAADPPATARTFDTLTVGGTIYTRVTIMEIKKTHVMFSSAQGFATVKIADLDTATQARLRGETPAPAEPAAQQQTSDGNQDKSRAALKVNAREDKDADEDEGAEEMEKIAPFEFTMLSMGGIGMMGLGVLTLLAGQVWLIVVAFRTSTGWGFALLVGTFVIGIITSMFCRKHWDVAKGPVVVKLIGGAMLMGGYFLFGF